MTLPSNLSAGDGDWIGYHGTSLSSALALLNGLELRIKVALALKIDGPAGFFLADDPDAAAFFAARRAPGAVLRYVISAAARVALVPRFAQITPIPQGAFSGAFPGAQLFIRPSAFPAFNRLRWAGAISVTPFGFG